MFKTAKQEQASGNQCVPSSFSLAEGTQLFFLPCHPSMDRVPPLPPALPAVSHSATAPFSPQHFLSSELLLSLCTTVVLFALAPGWEPAGASWAAGTCCSVSELLQEPHRAKSQISQPSLGRAVGPFYPVTNFCPILAKGKVLVDGVCNQF